MEEIRLGTILRSSGLTRMRLGVAIPLAVLAGHQFTPAIMDHLATIWVRPSTKLVALLPLVLLVPLQKMGFAASSEHIKYKDHDLKRTNVMKQNHEN